MEKNNAIILLGGTLYNEENVKKNIAGLSAYIICADGGFEHARNLNLTPDILIGDMDSVSKIPSNLPLVSFPAKKDDTDALLAVKYAAENGYKHIYLIAPFGGRMDHTMANLSLLRYAYENNIDLCMLDGINRIMVLTKGCHTLTEKVQYVSFFPLFEQADLNLCGFQYNGDIQITASYSVAISNEYETVAKVTVNDEPIIIVEILDR